MPPCPHCDSESYVRERWPRDTGWLCLDCDVTFDEEDLEGEEEE